MGRNDCELKVAAVYGGARGGSVGGAAVLCLYGPEGVDAGLVLCYASSGRVQFRGCGAWGDFVLIHVWGEKLQDCAVIHGSLETYSLHKGIRFGAQEQRESGDISSRPVGKADLGVWKVWPVAGAQRVEMWVSHSCRGYVVRSKIANVSLEETK